MSGVTSLLMATGFPRLASRSIIRSYVTGGSVSLYATTEATVQVDFTGGASDFRDYAPDWAGVIVGSGFLYQAMLTVISGPGPTSGSGTGIWVQPNPGNVIWTRSISLGANNFVWQLHIRPNGGSSPIAVAQYTFNVTGT